MSSVGVRLVTRLVFAAAQGATLQGILLVPLILGTFAFLQFINGSMAQHAENLPWETACDADVRPRLGTFDTHWVPCVAACLGVVVVITRWVLPIAGWTVEDRDVRRAKRISLDVVGGTLSPSRNHGGEERSDLSGPCDVSCWSTNTSRSACGKTRTSRRPSTRCRRKPTTSLSFVKRQVSAPRPSGGCSGSSQKQVKTSKQANVRQRVECLQARYACSGPLGCCFLVTTCAVFDAPLEWRHG